MRIPAIVEIEWIDSNNNASWMTPETWREWVKATVHIRTVGYLISEAAKCYTVATSWDAEQEHLSGAYQIPKSVVTKIRVLKKGKKNA